MVGLFLVFCGVTVSAQDSAAWPALHRAVSAGEFATFKNLLAQEKQPDVSGPSEIKPLHLAAEMGADRMVEELLNYGADPNGAEHNAGYTPLHLAVQNERFSVVEHLLADQRTRVDAESKDGFTALDLLVLTVPEGIEELPEAVTKMAESLIARGARVNPPDGNFGPLHYAAERGSVGMIRVLLEAGALVDAKGKLGLTPLHRAAQQGHVDAARVLIDRAVDKKKTLNARHEHGATPLLVACSTPRVAMGRYLIEAGADPSIPNHDGVTPLHAVAAIGEFDLAKALVRDAAPLPDVNAKRKGGYTPLHIAAMGGFSITAGIIVRDGRADLNVTNDIGFTPLELAHEYDHPDVIALLSGQKRGK